MWRVAVKSCTPCWETSDGRTDGREDRKTAAHGCACRAGSMVPHQLDRAPRKNALPAASTEVAGCSAAHRPVHRSAVDAATHALQHGTAAQQPHRALRARADRSSGACGAWSAAGTALAARCLGSGAENSAALHPDGRTVTTQV